MSFQSFVRVVCLAAAASFGAEAARAADSTTSISVQGMHCAVCARKVSAQLQGVPEAGQIAVDPAAGRATIAPRAQTAPSPRLLWEAVERAGYKPVLLNSPYGRFNQKPKS